MSTMGDSQVLTQDCCNNNGSPAKSKIPQLKFVKSAIQPGKENNSPKCMTASKDFQSSFTSESPQTNGVHAERWKAKYQESDRKYKALLVKNEKILREQNEIERKFQQVHDRNAVIENQLEEKEKKLNKLRTVSEKVYKEYDQLKNQYDVETQAMHQAMQSAGQWYKQNRKLKRQSAALLQKLPPQTIQEWDVLDAVDTASESSAGEELEGLRETVAGLSRKIAYLQTEISSLKLQEFEATELNVNLTQELEQEKENNSILEKRIQDLLEENERSKRLSRHLATEVSAFRDQLDQYKTEANQMKCAAESARKERDVLADRSSVYLETISEYEGPMDREALQNQEMLLIELEKLRSQIEEDRIMHAREIDELQGKILDRETSDEMFILEEKLNLAEDDVRKATERAEKAEKLLEEFENKRKSMASKISLFENQSNRSDNSNDVMSHSESNEMGEVQIKSAPPGFLPPPPPPPPPPPLMAPAFVQNDSNGKSNRSAIADMANILGIKNSTPKKKPTGGAIDEIVNQIKGGRFQLKSTEQKEKKPREEPAALKELLNILGTLKRRPKSQQKEKEAI